MSSAELRCAVTTSEKIIREAIELISLHSDAAYDRENRRYVCRSCGEFIAGRQGPSPYELIHRHQTEKLAEAGLLHPEMTEETRTRELYGVRFDERRYVTEWEEFEEGDKDD